MYIESALCVIIYVVSHNYGEPSIVFLSHR